MRFAAVAVLPAFTLFLAGCETAPPPANDLAFAQAACGGCHGVEANTLSPDPEAPTFADIANRPGLTRATLGAWLRDAHNYPEQMDFTLEPHHIDAMVDHLLRLQSANYRPPIS